MSVKLDGLQAEPVSSSDRPVAVYLVGLGEDPQSVAALLLDILNLTVTDMAALKEALPLMLYEKLSRAEAEGLKFRVHLIGGEVQLRVPREEHTGITKPFNKKNAAA